MSCECGVEGECLRRRWRDGAGRGSASLWGTSLQVLKDWSDAGLLVAGCWSWVDALCRLLRVSAQNAVAADES